MVVQRLTLYRILSIRVSPSDETPGTPRLLCQGLSYVHVLPLVAIGVLHVFSVRIPPQSDEICSMKIVAPALSWLLYGSNA